VFGSAVIVALEMDGKLAWRQMITNHAFDVALGSSPILFGDTVLLDCDQTGKTSTITAFNKSDGAIHWEAKRPETTFAHSTPVIVQIAGKPQMLVSAVRRDPRRGPFKRRDNLVVRRPKATHRLRLMLTASSSAIAGAVERRCVSIRRARAM
jgi:hypothetical protein